MDTAIARAPATRRAAFEDGLGKRYHATGPGGEPLEVLALAGEFTAVSSFEFALRERVGALAGFQHTAYARVRGVQRVGQDPSALAVVADRVPGARLSDVLAVAEQQLLPLEINAALYLIRQLVHGVAALHEQLHGVSHGAIAPERLVITPNARLMIVEHALGAALEQLQFSHDKYWKHLAIPLPNPAGTPRFDQRADILQVGAVALALIVGRPLYTEEYPDKIGALAERAWGLTATGGVEPLSAAVRTWLARALQLDARQSFASAVEAWAELDRVLGADTYVAPLGALRSFLAEYAKYARPAGPPTETVAPPLTAAVTPAAPAPAAAAIAPAATPPRPQAASPAVQTSPAVQASPATPAASPAPKARSRTHVPVEQEADVDMTNSTPWWRRRWMVAAVVLLALASGGALAGRWYLMPSAAAEASGTLIVSTNPAGAAVVIDGRPRGFTPLTLVLTPGEHILELVSDGEPRTIPLTIAPGATVSHLLELPRAVAVTGQLQVRSEPSGARVTVDGSARGVAPLTVEELAPGAHTVVLANDLGSVTHDVVVEAGATASLVVPMTAPQGAPVSGWISVAAPVDVQVYENERLIGSSQSDRIMVSVGRHELDLVNEALGYRTTRTVNVSPGQVSSVRPEWPKGSMALNAQPWADVFLDGERIGETPIGNMAVPIGPHEIVFRHPELGEQVVRTTVTLAAPARLSVDLRKR